MIIAEWPAAYTPFERRSMMCAFLQTPARLADSVLGEQRRQNGHRVLGDEGRGAERSPLLGR